MADSFSDEAVLAIDAAAAEIRKRTGTWAGSGLLVGPVTWHEAYSAPPFIASHRDDVLVPDSVGVTIGEESGPYARIVLYHYGWVDLDIVNWDTDDVYTTSGTPIRSVEEFGSFLDDVHVRLIAGRP